MYTSAHVIIDVNGASHTVDVDPDMPLLYALRNDLELKNPRFGCGLGLKPMNPGVSGDVNWTIRIPFLPSAR